MSTEKAPQLSQVGSRRSLFNNSLFSALGLILTTTVSLIAVPIVVNKLDVIGYGTWESIIAVSALGNIFQISLSGTLLWKISAAYGAGDLESVQQYVSVGVFFALLLFAIFAPLAWFWNDFIINLFQVPEQFRSTASIVLPSVVGLMLLGSLNAVMAALIQGFQQSGSSALIQAFSVTCNSLVVIGGLLLGLGFWSLLIGYAVGFLTYGTGLYLIIRRLCGSISLLPVFPRKATLSGTKSYAGFMLLGTVSCSLRDQADKIVLSSVASPVWTGYFGIAQRLSGLMLTVISFIYVPTIAAAGVLHSRDDQAGLRQLYIDVMTIMALIVGLSMALIAGLHDRLIIFWIGRPIPQVGTILYILILGSGAAVLFAGSGSAVCKGMGLIGLETRYIFASLILNIILKVVLVFWIGAIGSVISSAGSWALASVLFIVMLHKNTQLPVIGTLRALKGLILGVVFALCGRWLSHQIPLEPSRFGAFLSIIWLGSIITALFLSAMILCRALPISALASGAKFVRAKFASKTSTL